MYSTFVTLKANMRLRRSKPWIYIVTLCTMTDEDSLSSLLLLTIKVVWEPLKLFEEELRMSASTSVVV